MVQDEHRTEADFEGTGAEGGQEMDPSQTFCFRVSATALWVQGRRVACSRAGIWIDR
jgi:hypothetical protein